MPNPVESPEPKTRWPDRLFVLLQHALPQHLLSAGMYRLTRIGWPPLKNALIKGFAHHYRVDLGEAENPDLTSYPTFNAFFTRALRADARGPTSDPAAILGPADGQVSQAGRIEQGRILQAKGHGFSTEALLGGDPSWAERFAGGNFATIYLSPRDYHRVHMPYAGTLRKMVHLPGRLFSVNPVTTRLVPELFARNERVVCLFETAIGPMAVVLVGAIFVGSMETVWAGTVTPATHRPSTWHYGKIERSPIQLGRGAEMGRFNMGSTVILLLSAEAAEWSPDLVAGRSVRMGDPIGRALSPSPLAPG
jgi:phosphatidylserine decarboxylase